MSLGCPYPVQLRGREAKCLNIKASGTYCVTYRAFCWPWHRILQELVDISKKGKAPRDVTWTSYCNCFPVGLVVFVCLNCLFPEAKLTPIRPCKFCKCLKITIFRNLSNSVLFCSLFESHFARKDAWAIHVKLKLGDLYYTKPLCSARLKYVEKCEVSQFLALKLVLLLRWFTVLFPSCSTSLPSTVLPRSTLLERTVVFCVPVYWQKYLSGAHWVRWVRCSPGSFLQRRKKCVRRGKMGYFVDNLWRVKMGILLL